MKHLALCILHCQGDGYAMRAHVISAGVSAIIIGFHPQRG
jgi:hypothetical protein